MPLHCPDRAPAGGLLPADCVWPDHWQTGSSVWDEAEPPLSPHRAFLSPRPAPQTSRHSGDQTRPIRQETEQLLFGGVTSTVCSSAGVDGAWCLPSGCLILLTQISQGRLERHFYFSITQEFTQMSNCIKRWSDDILHLHVTFLAVKEWRRKVFVLVQQLSCYKNRAAYIILINI